MEPKWGFRSGRPFSLKNRDHFQPADFALNFGKRSFCKKDPKPGKVIATGTDFSACCVRAGDLYDGLGSGPCADADLSTCCKIIVDSSFLLFAGRLLGGFLMVTDVNWSKVKPFDVFLLVEAQERLM